MCPIATSPGRVQLLLVEDLRDEAHVPEHGQAAAVRDRDPGRLLAPVLEREEAEVGEPSHVALAERMPKTPHTWSRPLELRELDTEQRVAADDAEPPQRDTAEPLDLVRCAGEHRLAAALAEPGARVVRQADVGADPGVERGFRECDGEPAGARRRG